MAFSYSVNFGGDLSEAESEGDLMRAVAQAIAFAKDKVAVDEHHEIRLSARLPKRADMRDPLPLKGYVLVEYSGLFHGA